MPRQPRGRTVPLIVNYHTAISIENSCADICWKMGDYTKLGSMIANHSEAAIFRRFDVLNIKNLLYMQAEIVDLEGQLHDLESGSGDPAKALAPLSVQELKEAALTHESMQWIKYKDIRSLIHGYSTCNINLFSYI